MVSRLGKWWPFIHRMEHITEATHLLAVEYKPGGVHYHSKPILADWQNQWQAFGPEADTLALLNQLEELGYLETDDEAFILPWANLYRLLGEEENDGPEQLLALLKLPPLGYLRPSLKSDGSLEDLDFRITLGEWQDGIGNRFTPKEINGAVLSCAGQSQLLSEAVWRLVESVRSFYALPPEQRSPLTNRKAWGEIRRHALAARAPMADFLQKTVVLSPEKLLFNLNKSTLPGSTTIQVEPTFADAPRQWLDTFDRFATIPERYDIPNGLGIVQVLISPAVRSVLQEIRRWPGRTVAGKRAEAFLRNPYATLGDDALAVIDEQQFEQARVAAGIEFERFFVEVEHGDDGKITGVTLLIESVAGENRQSSRYPFADAKELAKFIGRFEQRWQGGFQCLAWEGYELEILGDAEYQLANLKLLLVEWSTKPTISLAYADVFDLGRYSERIEGIGVEKLEVSPYIARKDDAAGWIPENVEWGFFVANDQSAAPTLVPLTTCDLNQLEQTIDRAEQQGSTDIDFPGIAQPIPIGQARQLLNNLNIAQQQVQQAEFDPQQLNKQRQKLLLKSNIDHVDYREARKQTLELPSSSQALLPSALRDSVMLKQHQLQGVAWLQHLWHHAPQHCRGALLADDMGLGKTLQILAFIALCLQDEPAMEPVLVVAPVSLLENWQEEIDKFFQPNSLPVLMLYGNKLKAKKLDKTEIDPQLLGEGLAKFLQADWLGDAKLVLTTYETLRDLEFSLAAQPWSVMVCDEAQKIKNPAALVTRSAKKQNVRFKIACTGTPVENSLADLWCLFDFIQPGLLGALNAFGARYRKPIEAKTDAEQARLDELRALIGPQTLRRTKAQVAKDLPQKIEEESCRSLPMSGFQRQLYRDAVQTFRKRQNAALSHHLGLIQYLRLVCCNPYPHAQKPNLHEPVGERLKQSPKLAWLLETLGNIRQRQEKAIVFVDLLDLQRQLQHHIGQQLGIWPDIINGSTSAAASAVNSRQKRLKAFQERPGFGVIILSPLAVGFGVNIQAANHVIHFTRTWNPAKEDQATDRAYRIGQTKDVYVYYPVITAEFVTFDMKLDQLLAWKRGLAGDMLNGCGDLSAADFAGLVEEI